MTSGICEIIVGKMDVDSNKGVVVGHACGEANVDVFVLLLLPLCFHFCSFFTCCPKFFCSFVPTKSFMFLHLLSKNSSK